MHSLDKSMYEQQYFFKKIQEDNELLEEDPEYENEICD